MKRLPCLSSTVAGGLFLSASLAWGQIIFQDDFEGHDPGTRPGAPWSRVVDIEDAGIGTILVQEDTGNLFGAGTANRIVEYRKDDIGFGMALQASSGIASEDASTITTFSFEMYQPSEVPFNVNATTDLWVYAGGIASGNIVGRARFGLAEGTVQLDANYPLDTANHFDVVINSGADPFEYSAQGVDRTLGSAEFDVWLGGAILGSWELSNRNVTGPVASFQLNTASGGRILQYYDNFEVRNEVFVIPEPRTAAILAGLFAGGLVVLLRNRGLPGMKNRSAPDVRG